MPRYRPNTINIPSNAVPDLEGVVILDYDKDSEALIAANPDKYAKMYITSNKASNVLITGSSKNIWGQLQEMARNIPGGPYFMDGRDGNLTIHNKKPSRPIVCSYTYRGGSGELLKFSIRSKHVKAVVSVAKTSDIDPDSKDVWNTAVQALFNSDGGNSDCLEPVIDNLRMDINQRVSDPRYTSLLLGNTVESSNTDSETGSSTPSSGLSASSVRTSKASSSSEMYYSSEEAAKAAVIADPQLTAEEVQSYMTSLHDSFNTSKDPDSIDALDTLIHGAIVNDDLFIQREVRVGKIVDPRSYDPTPPQVSATTSLSYAANKASWSRGMRHLKENSGYEVVNEIDYNTEMGTGYYPWLVKAEVVQTVTVRVPIAGTRVLSSPHVGTCDQLMANDLTESIEQQMTATARVLGRPDLESSMNIAIGNVSKKYSGVWYTKKVTHSIGPNGYYTDIDFVQRDVPVTTNKISSSIITQKVAAEIQGLAEAAEETGLNKRVDKMNNEVVEYIRSEYPGSSAIAIDNGDGSAVLYISDDDFSTEPYTVSISAEEDLGN